MYKKKPVYDRELGQGAAQRAINNLRKEKNDDSSRSSGLLSILSGV